MRRASVRWVWLACVSVSACSGVTACSGGEAPPATPDTGTIDSGARCHNATECSDGMFCNGAERCLGDGGGDARGCAPATTTSPCATGETCDETADTCRAPCTDGDGDGHLSVACGGDDCDDTDGHRYPGNVEVCAIDATTMTRVDPTHDEDCNAMTYANGPAGDGDFDMDGFVDVACSNTDAAGTVFHGPDCADVAPVMAAAPFTMSVPAASVHPTESERCNGVDDDCNGNIDDALTSQTYYPDCDGDNFGDADAPGMRACRPETLACMSHAAVQDHTDCDDAANTVRPGATDVCDGADNDCNGTIDDPTPADSGCVAMFPAAAHATIACSATTHACGITCATNFADCDGRIDNGCEVDLRTNAAHCGTCATSCPVAATCAARACERITAIDAGADHTCALYGTSGHLVCWGHNDEGQLGDGTNTDRAVATAVAPPVGGTVLSFGYFDSGGYRVVLEPGTTDRSHTCAGNATDLYCWGAGIDGQLGDGLSANHNAPTQVAVLPAPLPPRATATSRGAPTPIGLLAGGDWTIALQREPIHLTSPASDVTGYPQWAWGQNGGMVWGVASPATSAMPVQTVLMTTTSATVPSIRSWSAGPNATCWVTNPAGALTCYGTSTPTLPTGWTGVAEVAVNSIAGDRSGYPNYYGGSMLCLRQAGAMGAVACYGNIAGPLGAGPTIPGLTDAIQITAGGRHGCAIRASGAVVCWGSNVHNALGAGGAGPPVPFPGEPFDNTPYTVVGITNAIQISAGAEHTCALLADHTVWCWGSGRYGEIGNGMLLSSPSAPVRVMGI